MAPSLILPRLNIPWRTENLKYPSAFNYIGLSGCTYTRVPSWRAETGAGADCPAFFPASNDRIGAVECLRARIDDDKIRGFSSMHG